MWNVARLFVAGPIFLKTILLDEVRKTLLQDVIKEPDSVSM
jgi:hypothetical protein